MSIAADQAKSARPRPKQYVEPAVSHAKFDRELSEYRTLEDEYLSRGWVLTHACFPLVRVMMCAAQLKPPAVIVEVEFDFTNYDAEPPSVTLVEPFTHRPYGADELPTILKRTVGAPAGLLPPGLPGGAMLNIQAQQPLMQPPNTPDDLPFLCVAGVREYHEHPAHSGDLWELHRESGAGRLARLLEVIHKYGVEPIADYQVQLAMSVTGFIQSSFPE
ncbi:MAG: putative metal-binding protein [Gaiellaceae bacterium]